MRDKGIKPVYLTLNDDLKIVPADNKIGFEDVFGTSNKNVYFAFEDDFKEYRKYLHDELGNTDLITSNNLIPVSCLGVANSCPASTTCIVNIVPSDGVIIGYFNPSTLDKRV